MITQDDAALKLYLKRSRGAYAFANLAPMSNAFRQSTGNTSRRRAAFFAGSKRSAANLE
jgi:hypothetical protein